MSATRSMDLESVQRGVKVYTPPMQPGQQYWFARRIEHFNEARSQGRHHIYGNLYLDGKKQAGVPLQVSWGTRLADERADVKSEDKSRDTPPWNYWYNFPMSPGKFNIQVNTRLPTEIVSGIEMGENGNSHAHTVTVVDWELITWQAASAPTEPLPVPLPVPVPVPPPAPSAGKTLELPVRGIITQHWGENPDLYEQTLGIPYHNGLDIGAPLGTSVNAPAAGTVMFVGYDQAGYGNYVRIYHPDFAVHTFMAHMQDVIVKPGDAVVQGQLLGHVGSTGNSTGPHCHFEIRLGLQNVYARGTAGHNNGRVDPETVLYFYSGDRRVYFG